MQHRRVITEAQHDAAATKSMPVTLSERPVLPRVEGPLLHPIRLSSNRGPSTPVRPLARRTSAQDDIRLPRDCEVCWLANALESRSMAENKLFYGDNLDVLRRYVRDESVDLIYLDPPFNSRQDYNVLFAEKDGTRSSSQITAFEDTWEWNLDAERAYQEVVEQAGWVSNAMQAFRKFLGNSDMMAYLAMMAPRLLELKRVLKATGSIYLHCDPTASHYLKLLMDAIFGGENYLNEITWKRTTAHSDAKQGRKGFGNITDILFLYTKSDRVHLQFPVWRVQRRVFEEVRQRRLGRTALSARQPNRPGWCREGQSGV